eukprot:5984043-Prymnesium_polylepis.2
MRCDARHEHSGRLLVEAARNLGELLRVCPGVRERGDAVTVLARRVLVRGQQLRHSGGRAAQLSGLSKSVASDTARGG